MSQQPIAENLSEIKCPIYCEWILEREHAIDHLCMSPRFPLPGCSGLQYHVTTTEKYGDMIVHFTVGSLEFDHIEWKAYAEIVLSINGEKIRHVSERIENEDNHIDMGIDCTFAEFKKTKCRYFINKNINIKVEGTLVVKDIFNPLLMDVEPKFSRSGDKGKNFVLVAEEKDIKVHKELLTEYSTVFAELFASEKWKETMEHRMQIPDFSHKIVDLAVDLLYGGSFVRYTFEEHVQLYQFADKYGMVKLKKVAKQGIILTPYNICEMSNFFIKLPHQELIDYCIDYLFVCSQYSYPIKDFDEIDPQIHSLAFKKLFNFPDFKKDLKVENKSVGFDLKNLIN